MGLQLPSAQEQSLFFAMPRGNGLLAAVARGRFRALPLLSLRHLSSHQTSPPALQTPLSTPMPQEPSLEQDARNDVFPPRISINRMTIHTLNNQVLSKHLRNWTRRVDVFHWWHRVTLNGLISLQIEKRLALTRNGQQMTKIPLMSRNL